MADNLIELESKAIIKQKEICIKYRADFLLTPFNSVIGIALDTFGGSGVPINGLRHSARNEDNAIWYIWAGEYSSADDFFKPVHVSHLLEICPKALHYLGLTSGWRFLFDKTYEDVWYDENLLS
ncbi:MAG: hypothetical protein JO080_06305 [Mucilaginibacter sp.]|nr:hypothetical protein [Mucilaginibacter sp.]